MLSQHVHQQVRSWIRRRGAPSVSQGTLYLPGTTCPYPSDKTEVGSFNAQPASSWPCNIFDQPSMKELTSTVTEALADEIRHAAHDSLQSWASREWGSSKPGSRVCTPSRLKAGNLHKGSLWWKNAAAPRDVFCNAFITKPKDRTGTEFPRKVGNGHWKQVKPWEVIDLGKTLVNTEFWVPRV